MFLKCVIRYLETCKGLKLICSLTINLNILNRAKWNSKKYVVTRVSNLFATGCCYFIAKIEGHDADRI